MIQKVFVFVFWLGTPVRDFPMTALSNSKLYENRSVKWKLFHVVEGSAIMFIYYDFIILVSYA